MLTFQYFLSYSITSPHPFEGSEVNLRRMFDKNKDKLESLQSKVDYTKEPNIKYVVCCRAFQCVTFICRFSICVGATQPPYYCIVFLFCLQGFHSEVSSSAVSSPPALVSAWHKVSEGATTCCHPTRFSQLLQFLTTCIMENTIVC